MAEYYEGARLVNGTWIADEKRQDHLAALARGALPPLDEFLREDHMTFMRRADRNYPLGWAFVTFLRHSTPENRQLFDKLWKNLRQNKGREWAITETFGETVPRALEAAFKLWLADRM